MVALSERDALLTYISDAHKDAYGFRPRGNWERYSEMSIEELHAEADKLSVAVADAIEEEDLARHEAAVRFEQLVDQTIANGAADRATALRWIFEAEDITETVDMYGGSYASYHFGLNYSYFATEYPDFANSH